MPQNSTILLKKSPENHQLYNGIGRCPMQRANWTTGKDGVPCSVPRRWMAASYPEGTDRRLEGSEEGN
jgi:hypothetical protein